MHWQVNNIPLHAYILNIIIVNCALEPIKICKLQLYTPYIILFIVIMHYSLFV